jgi:catalase
MAIHKGQTSYHRNGLNANQPEPAPVELGGYESYQEKIEGRKIRGRSESFLDFYSQAKLFYNSLTPIEQQHLKDALSFELGKCKSAMVKNNVVALLNRIDRQVAEEVADHIGAELPEENLEIKSDKKSPALSMANTICQPATKSVAILLNGKVDDEVLTDWIRTLAQYNINYSIVDKKMYTISPVLNVTDTFDTTDSSLFDAALLISTSSKVEPSILEFIETTYKHFKPLALAVKDNKALEHCRVRLDAPGVYNLSISDFSPFIEGIAQGRFWERPL